MVFFSFDIIHVWLRDHTQIHSYKFAIAQCCDYYIMQFETYTMFSLIIRILHSIARVHYIHRIKYIFAPILRAAFTIDSYRDFCCSAIHTNIVDDKMHTATDNNRQQQPLQSAESAWITIAIDYEVMSTRAYQKTGNHTHITKLTTNHTTRTENNGTDWAMVEERAVSVRYRIYQLTLGS